MEINGVKGQSENVGCKAILKCIRSIFKRMRIAIVNVAADTGGTVSVLKDCCERLNTESFCKHEWFVLTSKVKIADSKNVKCLQFPWVKKSWIHRLIWEYFISIKWFKENEIDIIFSLQNKALPTRKIPQIIYFHNLFLLKNNVSQINSKSFVRDVIFYFFVRPLTLKSLIDRKCIIVQTEFINKLLLKYNPKLKTKVISPTISINEAEHPEGNYKGKIYKGWIYPTPPNKYRQHEIIINALNYLKEVKKERIDFEVIFTFSEQESEYARKLAKMCEKIECIKLIGKIEREEVLKKYQEYGLVITSKFESCSIPIKEAIYYNAPIVCLDYDYAKEATQNYERVYMSAETPEKLGDNLLKIRELQNIGYSKRCEKSSWDEVLELVLAYGEKKENDMFI